MTKTEYLPYLIVKFKIKCLPASWLSIAFSDTDLMLQFRLPNVALTHQSHQLLIFFLGDRLTDEEIDEILQSTDTQEDLDGNIKFEGEIIFMKSNRLRIRWCNCEAMSAHMFFNT